jgi:hypothetical protein
MFKDKTKLIIGLVLIIIVDLILVYTLRSKPNAVNFKPIISAISTPQPSTTPQGLQASIQGWKVYQNKEYGFRINYPSEWRARETAEYSFLKLNVVNLISPDTLNSDKEEVNNRIKNFESPSLDNYFTYNSDISIFHYPSSKLKDRHGVKTIKELTEINDSTVVKVGKTQIGGIDATDFLWQGEGISYVIIFENNGYFYEIVLNKMGSKDIPDNIKQILSTFQLMK